MIRRTKQPVRSAYSIFMPTLCQGTIPSWYDETGYPVVYETELEAQREIAQQHLTLMKMFLDGECDFENAITVEDFILPVDIWSDGSISIEDGTIFGKRS